MPKNRVNNDVIVYRYFFAFSVISLFKRHQMKYSVSDMKRSLLLLLLFIIIAKESQTGFFFIVQNVSCVSILKSWLELFWYISIPRIRSTVLDTYNTRTVMGDEKWDGLHNDSCYNIVSYILVKAYWLYTCYIVLYALTSIKLFSFTFQQI